MTPQPPNLPQDIGDVIAKLEQRIRILETAASMTATSQKGGTFLLISPSTLRNMRLFGSFGAFYGDVLYDGQGNSVLMVRDDKNGLIKPELHLPLYPAQPWSASSASMPITSAGFVTAWRGQFRRAYHDAWKCQLTVSSDAATVGQIRVRDVTTGAVTSTLVTTAGTQQVASFEWLHPNGIGDDGNGTLGDWRIEVLRQSGAGNINVYAPFFSYFASSVFLTAADVNGHAQLF